MIVKKQYCAALIFMFVVTLSSCAYNGSINDLPTATLEFNKASEYSTLALADGKMIYQTLENPTCFFALDIEQNSVVELGSVSDFILNGYSLVSDSGKLYTYITIADDNDEQKNVLYEIDYYSNTISPLISNQNSAPIIYVYKSPMGILQLKTPSSDSSQTYFEVYEPQTGDSSVMLVAQENEIYIIASVNENSLFVFVALEMPDASYEFLIKEYDLKTYSLINTVELEGVHSYISKARIGKMEVFGDYIYMLNYSNEGIICKITDTTVASVLERENLECVWNQQHEIYSSERLFYVRNTAECFTLNLDTGEIKHVDSNLQSGYVIGSIFADGDDILLQAKILSDNKLIKTKTMIYLYDYYRYINSEA